jgi:hypothetical protein
MIESAFSEADSPTGFKCGLFCNPCGGAPAQPRTRFKLQIDCRLSAASGCILVYQCRVRGAEQQRSSHGCRQNPLGARQSEGYSFPAPFCLVSCSAPSVQPTLSPPTVHSDFIPRFGVRSHSFIIFPSLLASQGANAFRRQFIMFDALLSRPLELLPAPRKAS